MDFDDEHLEENSQSIITHEFNRAADYLQHLVSKLDQNTLLTFYGLYKQGTVGACNIPKPGIFNMQARAKWNAWNDLKDMTQETAMEQYVTKLNTIEPNWDVKSAITNDDKPKKSYWVSVSTPVCHDADEPKEASNKTIIDYVKEENLEQTEHILIKTEELNINQYDEDGLCAIHWAADRGNAQILELLLKHGADVNVQDSEGGQTALHYAASCGHLECVRILLKYNADRVICDANSATCLDLATESNENDIVTVLQS